MRSFSIVSFVATAGAWRGTNGACALLVTRSRNLDEGEAGEPYAEQAERASRLDLVRDRKRRHAHTHGKRNGLEDELGERAHLAPSRLLLRGGLRLEQLVDGDTEQLRELGKRRDVGEREVPLPLRDSSLVELAKSPLRRASQGRW